MQPESMKPQLFVHDEDKLNARTGSVKKHRSLGMITFSGYERNALKKWRRAISLVRGIIRTKSREETKETENDNELKIIAIPRRYPNWCSIEKNEEERWVSKMQGLESSMECAFSQQNNRETLITDWHTYQRMDSSNSSRSNNDESPELISSCLKGSASLELAEKDNLLLQELIGCAVPLSNLEEKDTALPSSEPSKGLSTESSAKLSGAGKRGCGIHWRKIDSSDSSTGDSSKLSLNRFSDSPPISGVGSVKRHSLVSSCA